AILGEMLELGDSAAEHHSQIAKLLPTNATIYSVGTHARLYGGSAHYNNVASLIASGQLQNLPPQAVILLKASHGVHLENTIGLLHPNEKVRCSTT
ncbi:MAG: hypothetical protein K8R90_12055, partial [Candidatus Cloacimonetes bacterium]|nr:hypothetical protein [Candidatus Cloacimonadota bacterium]